MDMQRVKGTTASLRALEDTQTGLDLGPVCESIKSKKDDAVGFATKDLTPRSLLQLTVRMLSFMESWLGVDAPAESRAKMTKIPFKLFKDTRPDGSLEVILSGALRWKAEHNLRKFEWSNADKASQHIEMLQRVERSLQEANLLPVYKIFITRAVPSTQQPKLRAMLHKRAKIVSTASAATHIVYPDREGTRPEDTNDKNFCRTIDANADRVLVHWYYCPDSYDSWLPADEVEGSLEKDDGNESLPWHVQMRWVEDTEIYNEWMNEVDYEVPEELRTRVIPAPKAVSEQPGKVDAQLTDQGPRRRSERSSPSQIEESSEEEVDHQLPKTGVKRGRPSRSGRRTRGDVAEVGKADEGRKEGSTLQADVQQSAQREAEGREKGPDDDSGHSGVRTQLPEQSNDRIDDDLDPAEKKRKLDENFDLPRDGKAPSTPLSQPPIKNEEQPTADAPGHSNGVEEKMEVDKVATAGENAGAAQGATAAANTQVDAKKNGPSVAVDAAAANNMSKKPTPATLADLAAAMPKAPIRIPAYSKWYKAESVHDIEKRALPEFFNGRFASKTERVYKEYRDFMIDIWRRQPEKYLTVTAVRRHLAGDVCAILRVHAFLEHWGLINHGVNPQTRPQPMIVQPPAPVPLAVQDSSGQIANAVPKMLLFDDGGPVIKDGGATIRRGPKLSTRRESFATAAAVEYHCDSCQRDCSRMRFHCSTKADMDLCPHCYTEKKFPPTISSRDFIQMTAVPNTNGYDSSAWTETETLLLLEALELYQDNWDLVAEHVGSKSKDACVLQFLRLPVEDSFLSDHLGDLVPKQIPYDSGLTDAGIREFTGQPLPFADASNPIMAHVAFMASMVPQDVAAAAASAALEKLKHSAKDTSAGMSLEDIAEDAVGKSAAAAALETLDVQKPNRAAQGAETDTKSADDGKDEDAVKAAAAVALAAAAVKAKMLADKEIAQMNKLFSVIIQTKLEAIEMKMKHFEKLEEHLRIEKDRVERHRQQLYAEKLSVSTQRVLNKPMTDRGALRAVPVAGGEIDKLTKVHPIKLVNLDQPVQYVQANTVKRMVNAPGPMQRSTKYEAAISAKGSTDSKGLDPGQAQMKGVVGASTGSVSNPLSAGSQAQSAIAGQNRTFVPTGGPVLPQQFQTMHSQQTSQLGTGGSTLSGQNIFNEQQQLQQNAAVAPASQIGENMQFTSQMSSQNPQNSQNPPPRNSPS